MGIYSYYIKNTSYTFEIDVPSLSEFSDRILGIAKKYPFFVLEDDGEILGYSYATEHNKRGAYRFGVDITIYLSHEHLGKGLGTKLYDKLFEELDKRGYYNAFSCITIPNEKSVRIHQKYGFSEVGRFKNAGYKFHEWHDILWLQMEIKEVCEEPKEPIAYGF